MEEYKRNIILDISIISLVTVLIIISIINLVKDNTAVKVYIDHYTGCRYLISATGDINNIFNDAGELYCGTYDFLKDDGLWKRY